MTANIDLYAALRSPATPSSRREARVASTSPSKHAPAIHSIHHDDRSDPSPDAAPSAHANTNFLEDLLDVFDARDETNPPNLIDDAHEPEPVLVPVPRRSVYPPEEWDLEKFFDPNLMHVPFGRENSAEITEDQVPFPLETLLASSKMIFTKITSLYGTDSASTNGQTTDWDSLSRRGRKREARKLVQSFVTPEQMHLVRELSSFIKNEVDYIVDSFEPDGIRGPSVVVNQLIQVSKNAGEMAYSALHMGLTRLSFMLPSCSFYGGFALPEVLIDPMQYNREELMQACMLMRLPSNGIREGNLTQDCSYVTNYCIELILRILNAFGLDRPIVCSLQVVLAIASENNEKPKKKLYKALTKIQNDGQLPGIDISLVSTAEAREVLCGLYENWGELMWELEEIEERVTEKALLDVLKAN